MEALRAAAGSAEGKDPADNGRALPWVGGPCPGSLAQLSLGAVFGEK